MRLGLLGPSGDDLATFARTAEFLLDDAKVTRAVYLGASEELEAMVAIWAGSLVGSDPTQRGIWDRVWPAALDGTAAQIDALLRRERARLRLKSLESLPVRELRSVEVFGDRMAVLVHDSAVLDEEDVASAAFLVYGKSEAPLAHKVGARWFLSPGPMGCSGGGALVLDDGKDEIVATFYESGGRIARVETLASGREMKLIVQG